MTLQAAPALPAADRAIAARFVRFAVTGASGVFVNLAVVWSVEAALLPAAGVREAGPFAHEHLVQLTALVAGIVVSIFTNFLINDRWTWGDVAKRAAWGERCRDFYLANGIAAGLQLALAWSFLRLGVFEIAPAGVDLTPWATRLASLAAILVATPLNFAVNHLWTFRARAAPDEDLSAS